MSFFFKMFRCNPESYYPTGTLSPLEECPVELKSTIDRWNKRWPGERDSRDRVWEFGMGTE